MKFSELVNRLTGISCPVFGVSWNPADTQRSVAEFRQYSCYAIPMAFIKKAIASGDFDDNDATPPMVFVVDDQNKK